MRQANERANESPIQRALLDPPVIGRYIHSFNITQSQHLNQQTTTQSESETVSHFLDLYDLHRSKSWIPGQHPALAIDHCS